MYLILFHHHYNSSLYHKGPDEFGQLPNVTLKVILPDPSSQAQTLSIKTWLERVVIKRLKIDTKNKVVM